MSWTPEHSVDTSAPHLCLATALLALILLPFGQALAEPRLNVLGLYPDRAAISIDGQMRVLKSGETSPEGVHLVSANSREAVVSVEGRERVLRPEGGRLEPLSESGPGQRVAIARNERGLFVTQGSINGMAVEMLV